VLLSGGKSRRFGTNKAFALWEGKPFYQVALEMLAPRTQELLISSNELKGFEGTPFPVIPDKIKGRGPLGGIATLLKRSRFSWLLVLACDMPLIKEESLDFLLNLTDQKKKMICFKVGSQLNPFPGLFHFDLFDGLLQRLSGRDYSMQGFIESLSEEDKLIIEVNDFISQREKEFKNINTKEEYAKL